MKLVFSENTGEYLNKKSDKAIQSSNLDQIKEINENSYEVNISEPNSIDKDIK